MEAIGYFSTILIGISLGLMGGGGSIFTVPVLVYLFGITPGLSTSYSLFVVGIASLVGAVHNYNKGCVSISTALLFGTTSTVTVFVTRKFFLPAIPQNLFTAGGITVTQSTVTMILFAVLMVIVAVPMISTREVIPSARIRPGVDTPVLRILAYGVSVGLTTGFFGAGGGFLLIPALVLLLGLTMKEAVGTSLLIIAMNSLLGFLGDLGHFAIDWPFLLTIGVIAIAGIFIGGYIGKSIQGDKLKKTFGWFVLAMGVMIILKETLK
jgi:uncharacterized protein